MENITNKVILKGVAGSELEVRKLPGNQKVAKANIIVTETYSTVGEVNQQNAQCFDLIFWNAKADIAESRLKKGVRLDIEGKLNSGNYESKDGLKRYTTNIVVTDIHFPE